MKFFAVLGLGLAAVATAQTSGNATVAATSHSTETATSTQSLSPEQTCLADCARTDICCQAACVKVPCPNQAQANATTECAAQCPQGNGSAGETENYASCQSSCISSLFFATATTVGNAATNSAASTTGGIVATTGSATTGGSGSSRSASASGSSASSTGAASHLQLGVTSAGILGLVVMGFAL